MQPLRKLQVDLEKLDVWERLKEIDSGLSVAQWLALDKKAYADVRDRLKFLHSHQVGKSSQAMDVNALEVDSEEENEEEVEDGEETDWDSTWSEGMVDGDDDSVSTEYNYPYDLQNMEKSIPLRGPVVINGQVV